PLDVSVPPDDSGSKPARSPVPLVLMIGGYGVAVAGGVIGGITGAMSISQTNAIKMACGGTACPPSKQGEIDGANSLATVSTIAVIAAGIGAAIGVTGTILFFSKSKQT